MTVIVSERPDANLFIIVIVRESLPVKHHKVRALVNFNN
jgi:hypothetical protein